MQRKEKKEAILSRFQAAENKKKILLFYAWKKTGLDFAIEY